MVSQWLTLYTTPGMYLALARLQTRWRIWCFHRRPHRQAAEVAPR